MTIQLSTLLDGFCDFIGDRVVSGIADSGSTTTLVDSELSIYGDGYFIDYFVYITSGDAKGNVRRIEAFTKVSGTVEPYVDFSAAIVETITYEIKKTNTQDATDALNEAIISLFPKMLHRKIIFESLGLSLLTGNALSGQKEVVVADGTLFFEGQKVTIKDDNNSEDATIDSISDNTLTMEDELTNAYTTDDNAKVVAKSGSYFNLGATIGNARVTGVFLRADSTSGRKPFLNYEIIQSLLGDRQIYFPGGSKSVDSQTWVIEAIDRLEAVSDPTDTITLEDRRVKLLYCRAAFHFYDRQANFISSGDIKRVRSLAYNYRDQVYTTYKNLWMPLPMERTYLGDCE